MIETVPLDMLLSLALGNYFGIAQAEKETTEVSVFESIYFRTGLAFHFVVAFGIAFICYLIAPDWMLMYFADRRRLPKGLVAYIFSGYFAMYTLGFLVVRPLKEVREEAPRALFVSSVGLALLFIKLTFHRLWHVGDYEAYHEDRAEPITRSALFPVLGAGMPGAVAGLALVARRLNRRAARRRVE